MVLKHIKYFITLIVFNYILYIGAFFGALFAYLTLFLKSFQSKKNLLRVKRRELPPPILNDPIYGQHNYLQIKNVKLHYVENGDRTKPLMLFLHGFPDFWFGWREQIAYYSRHYWTVAVDLRGYGDSEKPFGQSSYDIKRLVDDVKNLIDALGARNVILVSHDWGGIIAYSFLLKYPDLIEKYVSLSIGPPYAAQIKPLQIIKSWYIYFFQLPYLPEIYLRSFDLAIFDVLYKKSGEEIVEAYKFTFGKPGAFIGPVNYYRANFFNIVKYAVNGVKDLNDIKFPPGLAIYSEKDKYVDASSVENADLFVPNLKTEKLLGEGHFVHQYKPELVHKIINKFLNIELEGSAAADNSQQEKSLLADDGVSS